MVQSNIKKEFHCAIEQLWNIITDNTKYAWRSDLSKIEIMDANHFIEYDKNNYPTYFTILSNDYLKEYKFHIENTHVRGKWSGIFKSLENGTVILDFTEALETNHFLMRLLLPFYLKSQQKRYMKDLERELKRQSSSNNWGVLK